MKTEMTLTMERQTSRLPGLSPRSLTSAQRSHQHAVLSPGKASHQLEELSLAGTALTRRNLSPARSALTLLLLLASTLSANIVINELMYDPNGTDTGYEWLELYNNGLSDIDLEGARLLKAGSAYEEVFVFPRFILRAGRYLLLGETNVPNAQFTASLAFQNGGSETDAVRFESADGLYRDTVLYDEPNYYELPDDSGVSGSSFAPDAPQGYALARIMDGWDSNLCGVDFIAEAYPSPGSANPVRIDYGLYWPSLRQDEDGWICGIWVKNLSPISAYLEIPLEFRLDGVSAGTICACNISAGDSLFYENWFAIADEDNHLIEISLDLASDPDQTNNQISLQLYGPELQGPRLNEVMYRPATGFQEWIEIWQGSPYRGSYRIEDRAGNGFDFELPDQAGYFVVCASPAQLLSRYPDCPADIVIDVSGWATLNNDGDEVWLLDADGETIDSLSYEADATPPDRSLERYESQGMSLWRACLASTGATPGLVNSSPVEVPPGQSKPVAVYGSPCQARAGEQISVSYQLQDSQNRVDCAVWSRAGQLVRVLADNTLLPNTGVLSWDGRDANGRYVPRGLYYISWTSRGLSSGKEIYKRFSVAMR